MWNFPQISIPLVPLLEWHWAVQVRLTVLWHFETSMLHAGSGCSNGGDYEEYSILECHVLLSVRSSVHFGGICCLHLQNQSINQADHQLEACSRPSSMSFMWSAWLTVRFWSIALIFAWFLPVACICYFFPWRWCQSIPLKHLWTFVWLLESQA